MHWLARAEPIRATLPAALDPRAISVSLELEDGTTRWEALANGIATRGSRRRGADYLRHPVDLAALLGAPLPPGHHHLTLEGAGPPVTALVLAAPTCPVPPRSWAAFLPLHAVRSHDDWGTGSYTDLGRLGQWAAAHGAAMVGTLPLYPALLDVQPADPSPYLPVSRLAYNELFVDPTRLPELAETPAARDLLGTASGRASPPCTTQLVEYEEVSLLKRQVLEPMARTVLGGRLPERPVRLERSPGPILSSWPTHGSERARRPGGPGEGVTALTGYHLYTQWAAHSSSSAAGRRGSTPTFRSARTLRDSTPWSPSSFMRVQGGAPPIASSPRGRIGVSARSTRGGCAKTATATSRGAGPGFPARRLPSHRPRDGPRAAVHDPAGRRSKAPTSPTGRKSSTPSCASRRTEAGRPWWARTWARCRRASPHGARRMLRTWVFQFESTAADPLPDPRPLPGRTRDARPGSVRRLPVGRRHRGAAPHGALSEGGGRGAEERDEWRRACSPSSASDRRYGRSHVGALEGCLASPRPQRGGLVLVDLEDVWGEREAQNHRGPEPGELEAASARTLDDPRRTRTSGSGALAPPGRGRMTAGPDCERQPPARGALGAGHLLVQRGHPPAPGRQLGGTPRRRAALASPSGRPTPARSV